MNVITTRRRNAALVASFWGGCLAGLGYGVHVATWSPWLLLAHLAGGVALYRLGRAVAINDNAMADVMAAMRADIDRDLRRLEALGAEVDGLLAAVEDGLPADGADSNSPGIPESWMPVYRALMTEAVQLVGAGEDELARDVARAAAEVAQLGDDSLEWAEWARACAHSAWRARGDVREPPPMSGFDLVIPGDPERERAA